jgi:hypothetical protein
MKAIADYFSVSSEYQDISEIPFPEGSVLLHGANHEERSLLSKDFEIRNPNVNIVFIDEFEDENIKLSPFEAEDTLNLRSRSDSDKFTRYLDGKNVYIDITGLTHSVWAWIVRSMLLRENGTFFVIYSEPGEYRLHDSPLDGQIFDLSEKIVGISPLPGLALLTRFTSDNFLFMPLLGFEGARLAHIMEDVQPIRELTFPVIGVPGFQHEYPFYTYQGNRLPLDRDEIWMNWRYEKANCPASIYILGETLLSEYPAKKLRIAPIGTKPHALGAVLLKLAYPSKVDIVYDHPIRKKGRTKGTSKTLCYCLDPFKEVIIK